MKKEIVRPVARVSGRKDKPNPTLGITFTDPHKRFLNLSLGDWVKISKIENKQEDKDILKIDLGDYVEISKVSNSIKRTATKS